MLVSLTQYEEDLYISGVGLCSSNLESARDIDWNCIEIQIQSLGVYPSA